MMASPVIDWITVNVGGLSFCDIGGIGLNSLNERISPAISGRASSVTMIDYRRFDFPEWDVFKNKMVEAGNTNVNMIDDANLEDRTFPSKVGQFDFVHCTGILYHAPSPMTMLDNLSKITRRFLIVNTVIVPERIENARGTLAFPGAQCVFLPALTQAERDVFDLHYQEKLDWDAGRFSLFAPRLDDPKSPMPWLQTRAASERHFWGHKGDLSYSPYWWLFSANAFRAAVRIFGFSILAEHSFKGHTLTLFCQR